MVSTTVDEMAATDTGRLGELYLRHADDAVRLAYLLTGERALAEDLVQDAFVRLAGRLAHLRDPGAFEAYLRRTVVNLANSHFRRRKVERAYLERTRGTIGPDGAQLSGRSFEDREVLWQALMRLSARQRAALVLRYVDDLSVAAVARAIGRTVHATESLLARARDSFRNAYATGSR